MPLQRRQMKAFVIGACGMLGLAAPAAALASIAQRNTNATPSIELVKVTKTPPANQAGGQHRHPPKKVTTGH